MKSAVAEPVDIGTLISRTPGIKSGTPHISGTGVTVKRIAGWYKLGMDPDEIARTFGHISVGQVHAALAYYHANTAEIERLLAEEEADHDRLAALYPRRDP